MRLALRELRRRPRGFAVPAGILLLLALLLLYPTAVLDGLYDSSTGGLRALPGQLVVYTKDAHRSLFRSRIDPQLRREVEGVAGVEQASAFSAMLLSGRVEGREDPYGLAVIATEAALGAPAGRVPGPGEAIIDASLREQGVREGTMMQVGPFKVLVKVVGFIEDTNLMLQSALLVDQPTWQKVLGQNKPLTQAPSSQVLVLRLGADADATRVADAVDTATNGRTDTISVAAAIRALPGIEQQDATFGYIRMVTLAVALVVVGLFLSFVTLERTSLYAVLKAIGASSRQLFSGVLAQVLVVALVAVAISVGLTLLLSMAIPIGLPTTLRVGRVIETALGLAFTAALGSALSLRRVVRIDPASAIG